MDEHVPSGRKRSRRNQKAPTRGHVANLLGMKTVTPRSLAYVAAQVLILLLPSRQLNKFKLVTLCLVQCWFLE